MTPATSMAERYCTLKATRRVEEICSSCSRHCFMCRKKVSKQPVVSKAIRRTVQHLREAGEVLNLPHGDAGRRDRRGAAAGGHQLEAQPRQILHRAPLQQLSLSAQYPVRSCFARCSCNRCAAGGLLRKLSPQLVLVERSAPISPASIAYLPSCMWQRRKGLRRGAQLTFARSSRPVLSDTDISTLPRGPDPANAQIP